MLRLLLVEDNDADARLTREAFNLALPAHTLARAADGEAALDLLRSLPADQRPHAIILDLNLPRMDGRELLARLRETPSQPAGATPDLCDIPVVVLTTSDNDAGQLPHLRSATDRYIVKPLDFGAFQGAIQALGPFWNSLVRPAK
jgi:CheY-like chemotaxis protein